MKVLNNQQVLEQFIDRRPPFDEPDYVQGDERGLFYIHSEASCIDVKYPPELERLAFFARYLATIGYESDHFDGALLWFTTFGVWNGATEGIGYRIIEQMNRAAGQPSSFETALGHSFRADELNEAVGMLIQPMLFGWDAYYLPRWSWGTGEFFLHISHDSHVVIATKTKAFHDKIFSDLMELNYNPAPYPESRANLFCRK